MQEIHYYNLTNGLEDVASAKNGARFIRIQSTQLEQKHFGLVIMDLDNDLLMHLALGYKCVIHDKASRSGNVSRACWYGIPWIKYCLERVWFNRIPKETIVKTFNLAKYFAQQYKKLGTSEKRKLKYYKKFLMTNSVNLEYQCCHTEHDGDHNYYRNLAEKFVLDNKIIEPRKIPFLRSKSWIL